MQYELIIGFISPFIIDFLNRTFNVKKSEARKWVAVAFTVVVSVALNWDALTNGISLGDVQGVLTAFVLMFTTAQVTYDKLYEDTTVQHTIRGKNL